MIIQHHQFKNAIVHLSEEIQKEYPNEKVFLDRANLPHYWAWQFHLFYLLPENVIGDNSLPLYSVGHNKIGNEEILLLKDTFIEVKKVDMALEIADWFVKTVDNVSEAHLRWLGREYSTLEILYGAKTDSNEWLEIEVGVNVEENRVVSSGIKLWKK